MTRPHVQLRRNYYGWVAYVMGTHVIHPDYTTTVGNTWQEALWRWFDVNVGANLRFRKVGNVWWAFPADATIGGLTGRGKTKFAAVQNYNKNLYAQPPAE